MSNAKMTPQQRLQKTVEIGMVYLRTGTEANKQFGLECMLALLTGSNDVPAFRRRFRHPAGTWKDGTPL